MRYLCGYAAAVLLLVLILCQSIIMPSFFMPFFRWQYTRLEVAEHMDMDFDELMHATTELLDYMRGRRENLAGVRATVAGEQRGPAEEGYREFFENREEIIHMEDVRVLYDLLFLARNLSFWGFLAMVCLMAIRRYRIAYWLARCTREVFVGFLGLLGLTVVLVLINFDRAFEIFHLILFNNDYWLLNPRHSLLINMLPIGFFMHIAIFIGMLMAVALGGIIAVDCVYLAKEKRRQEMGLPNVRGHNLPSTFGSSSDR